MSDPAPDSGASRPRLSPPPPDDIIFFQVRDALKLIGCPVCRLGRTASQRYLTSFLHEQVNDPHTRQRILASRGFCRRHGWMLTLFHDALGTAIVYRHLLEKLSIDLHHTPAPRRGRLRSVQAFAAKVRGLIRPQQICPACESVASEEESALMGLVRRLGDPEVAGRVQGPSALCLPHLLQGIGLAPDIHAARWLIQLHRERYAQLIRHLSELIRKHDYRFSHEPVRDEEAISKDSDLGVPGLESEPVQSTYWHTREGLPSRSRRSRDSNH